MAKHDGTTHSVLSTSKLAYRIVSSALEPMTTQKILIAKHFGLRGIALLEAGKGLVAVMVAVWLVSLLHKI